MCSKILPMITAKGLFVSYSIKKIRTDVDKSCRVCYNDLATQVNIGNQKVHFN